MLDNVRFVTATMGGSFPVPDGAWELVVACAGRDSAPFLRGRRMANELVRVLDPEGVTYLETSGYRAAWRMTRIVRHLRIAGFESIKRLWTARKGGDIHMAIRLGDERTGRYLFDRVLSGVSLRARLVIRAGATAARLGVLQRLVPARVLVARRTPSDQNCAAGPPYLAALAERAGVNPLGFRQAFFARGRYDSNKVAFFLFPEGEDAPSALVKITRTPRFNVRLETEYRAIAAIEAKTWAEPGTYPKALFFTHHCGHALVGEAVVDGVPLRVRSRGAPDCEYAAAAMEWITGLGERSADACAVVARRADLTNLNTMIADRFPFTDLELEFIGDRLSVAADSERLPSVLQHGDAGIWNVLAIGDRRVAFLDWEAARIAGFPLFDLFDFLRSLGAWADRSNRSRGGAEAYRHAFLEDTGYSRLQAVAVTRYLDRVGMTRDMVEPLFYACWASRAVRESAWASGPPENGLFFRILRLCIRERSAHGLRCIFD